MLGHMVYFTLKDSSDEATQRLIGSCKEYLSGHSGTIFFAVGTRVPDLTRDVNDKEFHVALQLVFESRAAQDAYQDDQRHEEFIQTNRDNWAQVRVFDTDLS